MDVCDHTHYTLYNSVYFVVIILVVSTYPQNCANCVTPRSVPIPKSHWLADSLAYASGRRTPDGPPPVTTAPCLHSLTVVVGIKQGEILGRTEQYKHAHSIYTVHDVIQEVISYTMFPVRYISPPLSSGRPRPGFFTRQ